ncbi:hypothetical protein A2U01_0067125, partial [Trifolium medium]|nr:hypothetical protein [Trifolium medium]
MLRRCPYGGTTVVVDPEPLLVAEATVLATGCSA